MAPHLRLFPSPDNAWDEDEIEHKAKPSIRIRLGDLLPLVAMAQQNHFIWLKDFLDDEISISDDLHDVIMAFRSTRPA
jgi:hypothetical protein